MTEAEQRKIFSDNLTKLLQRCGKTQLQLANRLDVSKSTVSSWCSGSKMPRMGKIDEIADWLSVSRSELIEENGVSENFSDSKDVADLLEALRSRPEMRMLFSVSKDATKEDIEKAVAIIEALRKTEGR